MSEHQSLLSPRLLRHARGLRVFAFLALSAAACGPESSTGDPGGGGAAGGAGGSGSGAGQTTTGQGGGTPQPKTPGCYVQCSTVDDCVHPAAPFDADNYACEGSFCIYKGCNSTAECVEAVGPKYACAQYPGTAQKDCHRQCSTVDDCVGSGTGAAYDADNFACEGGICVYKGCNSTAECVDSLGSSYACVQYPGSAVTTCNFQCSTAGDCAAPAGTGPFDADNFACEGSLCIYKGCNSTAECVAALGSKYACVEPP